jgi:hypothetical protein
MKTNRLIEFNMLFIFTCSSARDVDNLVPDDAARLRA